MKHIHKIRLFNPYDLSFRYPNETGHFYPHKVGNIIVMDNNISWPDPYFFDFVPAVIQQFMGKRDVMGKEIYEGNLPTWEICHYLTQHSIWLHALSLTTK